jgi:hypothetical protein
MTYADLIAEIKLLSKRGDIDDKIAVALRLTTLRAHHLDFFWRDLVEANLTFAMSNIVTVDVSTSLTRFRQVNYLQYYDPTTGALGTMLDEVDPSAIFDDYNYQKADVWYLAGTNLQVSFLYATAGARIGYFQNPDVAAATYNSWIKDELPDLLIQGSLAYIYNMTGKQEEARAINRMVGFEPDPANRAPGMTLCDQLRAIGIRGTGRA